MRLIANETAKLVVSMLEGRIDSRFDELEAKIDRFLVNQEAMKSLRGRPKNSEREAGVLSQRDMAEAFGRPCTKMMVYNWEKGRSLRSFQERRIACSDAGNSRLKSQ